MTHVFTYIRGRAFSGCLVLVCCLVLTGCFEKTVIRPSVPPGTPVSRPTADASVEGAEAALHSGQTARAEQVALRLYSRSDLSDAEMARVARVLSLSANANNHPNLALKGLERWLSVDPAADGSAEWRSAFLSTMGQLPPRDGQARAQSLMADTARPFPLRAGAVLFLASLRWENAAAAPQTLVNLQTFYAQAGERRHRAHMEHSLFARLQSANDLALANLDGQVTEENSKTYPYAIIRLESLRRRALHAETREEARAEAQLLAQNTTLADPALLKSWDVSATQAVTAVPVAGRTLVLALPLSGQLGGISKKILQGAEEARAEFAAAGHTVNVVQLDTQDPSWMDKLASFPPQASIVGGPLRMESFTAAQAKGLTTTRAFFTFMGRIGDAGEEGRVAWRFFPSPEDQLAALFNAAGRLGITEYAILMPSNDAYAAKIADRFTARAQAAGGRVVKRAEYPKGTPADWNKFVAGFLGTNKHAGRAPSVSHRAIFLPDSWRNMEIIVPNLFYFLESRQLLLGTSLWEQGLSGQDHVAAHYYNLAVFPGAWDKTATLSPAAARLQAAYARAGRDEPDFWAGLGYDFVRFGAILGISQGWTPQSVNAALSGLSGMVWSMAPIQWSPQGKASQSLFLFTPEQGGFGPADMTAIEERFNKAWRR